MKLFSIHPPPRSRSLIALGGNLGRQEVCIKALRLLAVRLVGLEGGLGLLDLHEAIILVRGVKGGGDI